MLGQTSSRCSLRSLAEGDFAPAELTTEDYALMADLVVTYGRRPPPCSGSSWGPPGDHTVSLQPNNPQVATRHMRQAERL